MAGLSFQSGHKRQLLFFWNKLLVLLWSRWPGEVTLSSGTVWGTSKQPVIWRLAHNPSRCLFIDTRQTQIKRRKHGSTHSQQSHLWEQNCQCAFLSAGTESLVCLQVRHRPHQWRYVLTHTICCEFWKYPPAVRIWVRKCHCLLPDHVCVSFAVVYEVRLHRMHLSWHLNLLLYPTFRQCGL